jgi:hypothetical protein
MNIITLLGYIPAIITVIKAVEEAIPGQGQGEAKLAALREMLELVDSGFEQVWPKMEGIVGVLVDLFNKTGWGRA